MATNVRVYEIATSGVANLNDNEICNETSADADLGFKMWGGKGDDSATTKWLAKNENAKVADLNVTGDVTIVSGTITCDALSLSTLNATGVLYGDFSQASTFFWKSSKLRIGSTDDPAYMIDIESTSANHLRLENSNADSSGALMVLYKNSDSPADNDIVGQFVFRGTDADESAQAAQDYCTLETTATDVSGVTGKLEIKVMREGVEETVLDIRGTSTTIYGRTIVAEFVRAGTSVSASQPAQVNLTRRSVGAFSGTNSSVGFFGFNGPNDASGHADKEYASISGVVVDDTAGAEGGAFIINTTVGGARTEVARFDENANMGLGNTAPESWDSTFTALQIEDTCSVAANASNIYMSTNAYYDDTNNRWEFINNGESTQIYLTPAAIVFVGTLASGSADDPITYVDMLTLANSTEEIIVNDGGEDLDFRVESASETDAIYMIGSTSFVGFGKTPSYKIDIDLATDDLAIEDADKDLTTVGVHAGCVDIVVGGVELRLKAYERNP